MNDVDRSHFRPLQQQAFLCQARCCDSSQTQADLRNWCAAAALHSCKCGSQMLRVDATCLQTALYCLLAIAQYFSSRYCPAQV